MAVVFDTLKQHRVLVEGGFSDPQAQAITSVTAAVLDAIATKSDLKELEGRLDAMSKRLGDLQTWGVAMFGVTLTAVFGLYAVILTTVAPHLR